MFDYILDLLKKKVLIIKIIMFLSTILIISSCNEYDGTKECLSFENNDGLEFTFRELNYNSSHTIDEWKKGGKYSEYNNIFNGLERSELVGKHAKIIEVQYKEKDKYQLPTDDRLNECYIIAITEECQEIIHKDRMNCNSIKEYDEEPLVYHLEYQVGYSIYALRTLEKAKRMIGKIIDIEVLSQYSNRNFIFTEHKDKSYIINKGDKLEVIGINKIAYGHMYGDGALNLIVRNQKKEEGFIPFLPHSNHNKYISNWTEQQKSIYMSTCYKDEYKKNLCICMQKYAEFRYADMNDYIEAIKSGLYVKTAKYDIEYCNIKN